MGSRLTVFPRAAWATFRGLGRDADVVLEVVNGIAFFTPLLALAARAARRCSSSTSTRSTTSPSSGLVGPGRRVRARARPAALPVPRRAGRDDLAELAREALVGLGRAARAHPRRVPRPRARRAAPARARAERRRSSTSGRLKRYKRIELLLDVAAAVPDATLRHRRRRRPPRRRSRRASRELGLDGRVVFHGHVDEAREGAAARRVVGRPHRVLGRGLVPDRHGGRRVRDADRGAARRRPARRRSSTAQTGVLVDTPAGARRAGRATSSQTPERRARWATPRWPARAASRGTTPHRATSTVMTRDDRGRTAAVARRPAALGDRARRPGSRPATLLNNAIQLVVHGRLHAPARRERLRHARGARLGLPDPARRRASACRSPPRARPRSDRLGHPEAAARDAARVDAAAR